MAEVGVALQDELRREAFRVEEDSIHSGKAHYEAATRWRRVNLSLGIPATVVAAAAGVSAFKDAPLVGAFLAFTAAALSALLTFLNPDARASAHAAAGAAYIALRNQARIFANIDLRAQDHADSRAFLAELASKRDELNASSPAVPKWAFEQARRGIAAGQSEYRVDST